MSFKLEVREATEEDLRELEEASSSDEDYGFIIGPNGELKSLILPDKFQLNPPKKVKRILKILGFEDINMPGSNDTIH